MASSIEQALRRTPGLTIVGEYELLALIARGGMGTVYLCRRKGDFGFVRLFALKMLHEHLADEGAYISMFLDEARIGARLHHPNIAAAVDLGTFHGGHYVVMDYVEGCSLADLQMRLRNELPIAAVLHIVIDALEGLQAAHSVTGDDGEPLGLVHRDVSPGNVLIGVEGTARITDFGIAKLELASTRTRSGERKGKFAFMSPEQVLNDKVDHRSDLFSMGVVLWNALTGRALFGRRNDGIAIHKVMHMPISRPSDVSERCPTWVDEICMRALQRDPDKRYQSASEMSAVIREISASESAGASPRDVSQLVHRAFSQELEARRMMLRPSTEAQPERSTATRLRTATSLPTFSPLVSESEWTASPTSGVRLEDRRRRPFALWLGSVALVGALVAGGVLYGPRLLDMLGGEAADREVPVATSQPPVQPAQPPAQPAQPPAPDTASAPVRASSILPAEPGLDAAPPSSDGVAASGRATRRTVDKSRGTGRSQPERRERRTETPSERDTSPSTVSREADEEKPPPTDNLDPWRAR